MINKLKHIYAVGLLAVITFLLTGCRVNNGDIGALYGTWAIEDITVDGEIYEDWQNPKNPWTSVEFQNNICIFKRAVEPNGYIISVSTWSWIEGTAVDQSLLTLDFNHHDNKNPAGTGIYAPPQWLLLDGQLRFEMLVDWSSNKRRMTWTTVNGDGQTLVLRLKQTW